VAKSRIYKSSRTQKCPLCLKLTKQSTHNHTNQQKILLYKVEYLKKISSAIHLQHFSAHFHLSHSITLCNLQECNQQHIPAIRHPPPPVGYLIYIDTHQSPELCIQFFKCMYLICSKCIHKMLQYDFQPRSQVFSSLLVKGTDSCQNLNNLNKNAQENE
jgi:hypothetical protein